MQVGTDLFAKIAPGVPAVLALAILVSVGVQKDARADEITIVADEWCPYNCVPGSDKPGYMIEIARAAFESAGHTVVYSNVPWSRAISDTRDGKYSAIVGAAYGDAEDFVFPENPLGSSDNTFFVKADDGWSYSGAESLVGKKVGLINDYEYGPLGEAIAEHGKAEMVGGDKPLELNFKKLVAGRIDAVMEDPNVAALQIQEMGIGDKVKAAGSEGDPLLLFIAFSPSNPKSEDYAQLLSDAVAAMRSDGRLAAILEKYGLSDWQ